MRSAGAADIKADHVDASKEYSRCVESYLQPEDKFITCVFEEIENGRIVQKGVSAKMARGEMVRYMAANNIQSPEQIRKFYWSGYHYREDLSSETEYVFIRTKIPGRAHERNKGKITGEAQNRSVSNPVSFATDIISSLCVAGLDSTMILIFGLYLKTSIYGYDRSCYDRQDRSYKFYPTKPIDKVGKLVYDWR